MIDPRILDLAEIAFSNHKRAMSKKVDAAPSVAPGQTAARLLVLKAALGERFLFHRLLRLPELLGFNERLYTLKKTTDFKKELCEGAIIKLMAEVNATIALRANPVVWAYGAVA